MSRRIWTETQFRRAVKEATSVRQVLKLLGLKEAGGNYTQINKYLNVYRVDSKHFRGQAWNKGLTGIRKPRLSLDQILVKNSSFQSHKLKKRLFEAGMKKRFCELCGWAEMSVDGRIPVELDHINGVSTDNRIKNLRVLCPNCHSLQPTHRGKNINK